jgi:hypothetical protein
MAYDPAEPRDKTGKWSSLFHLASPAEYSKFSYPDYSHRGGLAGLAQQLEKTGPGYYEALRDDIRSNGVKQPVLVRYRINGTGRKLPSPQVMDGHHRAAVAYELGLPILVGDYDNQEHYDAAMSQFGSQDWFSSYGGVKAGGVAPWRTSQFSNDGHCPNCGCPQPASITDQIELAFDPAEPRDKQGKWYHGTHLAGLKSGDLLGPGHGKNWGYSSQQRIYISSEPHGALGYGDVAAYKHGKGLGAGHVYEVTPTGPVEQDQNSVGRGDEQLNRQTTGARVVRELSPAEALTIGWHQKGWGDPPAELLKKAGSIHTDDHTMAGTSPAL